MKQQPNYSELSYQKQLFVLVDNVCKLKNSILTETFLLANNGKEKKVEQPIAKLYYLKRKQEKVQDENIEEAINFMKLIDKLILNLEGRLQLKNNFINDVFEEDDYLCNEPKATLKEK